MNRIRFALIGSGYRAMFYVRIAKALPDLFDLCAVFCRSEEKADMISHQYGVHACTDIADIISGCPDLIVTAVDKAHGPEAAMEWLERGYAVLAETPAASDLRMLERLRAMADRKYVVAEQYHLYPEHEARLKLIQKGLIGSPDHLYLSAVHDYHAASLMRKYLDISCEEPFRVRAESWNYTSAVTRTRYEEFHDGRTAGKTRTAALFTFDNGKGCVYDFDSDQYHSLIRSCHIRVQGTRGEIFDNTVSFLDGDNIPRRRLLQVYAKQVRRDDPNPNMRVIDEVTKILLDGEVLYTPPFGECGLSQDETAVARLLKDTASYAKGKSPSPYPAEEAFRDAYMAIRMKEAAGGQDHK